MFSCEITLTNPSGLHARPAALLVELAKSFSATITLQYGEKSADAKSILSVLSLGASRGASLTIVGEGVDETNAVNKIAAAFTANLGEV